MTCIPKANAAKEASSQKTISTYPVMDLLVANAINTAVGSGAFTCTFSTAGKTSADLQAVELFLAEYGYTWSRASNTVTVSWA